MFEVSSKVYTRVKNNSRGYLLCQFSAGYLISVNIAAALNTVANIKNNSRHGSDSKHNNGDKHNYQDKHGYGAKLGEGYQYGDRQNAEGIICPQCRSIVSLNAKFCSECGTAT
ncbi:Uncharacterised protein family UPF0547 [Providencia alcalifaciens]|nr:Uncharacterised protein family UPF0547 [Providencia alcalifaciens]